MVDSGVLTTPVYYKPVHCAGGQGRLSFISSARWLCSQCAKRSSARNVTVDVRSRERLPTGETFKRCALS